MGSFVSHAAKVLLLVVLLAQAGSIRPVTAADVPVPPDAEPAIAALPHAHPVPAGLPAAEPDAAAIPPAIPVPAGPADPEPVAAAEPAAPSEAAHTPLSGAFLTEPVYRLPSAGMEIVLTIDDGPSALTDDFLAVLEEEGVPAAFFWLSGSSHLPLAAEVVARGHQLGTHTITHPRLPRLDPAEVVVQIAESKAAIEGAAGAPVRYFRPPYGEHDQHVLETAAAHGLATVLWNVDSRDWALADAPEQIIANVMAQVRPGAVILIHERRQTLEVLPELIRRLREAGYTFVPLPPVPDGAMASYGER